MKLSFKYHLNPADLPKIWPSILVNGPPFCGKTKVIKSIAGVTSNIWILIFLFFSLLEQVTYEQLLELSHLLPDPGVRSLLKLRFAHFKLFSS